MSQKPGIRETVVWRFRHHRRDPKLPYEHAVTIPLASISGLKRREIIHLAAGKFDDDQLCPFGRPSTHAYAATLRRRDCPSLLAGATRIVTVTTSPVRTRLRGAAGSPVPRVPKVHGGPRRDGEKSRQPVGVLGVGGLECQQRISVVLRLARVGQHRGEVRGVDAIEPVLDHAWSRWVTALAPPRTVTIPDSWCGDQAPCPKSKTATGSLVGVGEPPAGSRVTLAPFALAASPCSRRDWSGVVGIRPAETDPELGWASQAW